MLILQTKECDAIKVKSLQILSLEGCYNKDWVAASNKQNRLKSLQCSICKQIANNAMELTCNEHEDHNDALVVGEQCLMKYLQENNNQCPTKEHNTCSYMKGRTIRRFVNELKVICPRQFVSYSNQRVGIQKREGGTITEIKRTCTFKGKIEEIKEHLENACPLKILGCKYKDYGCDDILYDYNFEEHLESQMKKHLHLLSDHIAISQKQSQLNEVNCIVVLAFKLLFEEKKQLRLKIKEQGDEIQSLKLSNDDKHSQIEELLKQKQQWNEMKNLYNNLLQEVLKYQVILFYLFLEIDELNCKLSKSNTENGQLKEQIQNKNYEIIFKQNIKSEDKQIINTNKLVQQLKKDDSITKKDINDKEKLSLFPYEQYIQFSKKDLILPQDYQKIIQKIK
ncbi:viral A-type inclusion protein [Reticulomyxa filosa]|uniref:Viral A-type inclusion protein n=1 Tax=Reticulomyxa filosa TaxID=46433 RepID=X6MTL8_RETFI|nr:viral A-type inclusion protein [Reticulomyxa filosa]|eukprot:ETO17313.1 viral A-type inclusion protein [Reticulomyxa filosa]